MAFIAKSAAPVASARRRGTGPSTGPRSEVGLTGIQITPAAGGEDQWRRWLRDNGIDWDGQVA